MSRPVPRAVGLPVAVSFTVESDSRPGGTLLGEAVDTVELGVEHEPVRRALSELTALGGCWGTDRREVVHRRAPADDLIRAAERTHVSLCVGAARTAASQAPIAQSAERLHGKEKVCGSIPHGGSGAVAGANRAPAE